MPIGMAFADLADRRVDLCFRRLGKRCHLLGRGEIKDRRPCVRHPHGAERIDLLPANRFACHGVGRSRRCAVGGNEIEVIRMEIRFFEELLHDAGKAPEVCGGDNADRVIRESVHAVVHAVYN